MLMPRDELPKVMIPEMWDVVKTYVQVIHTSASICTRTNTLYMPTKTLKVSHGKKALNEENVNEERKKRVMCSRSHHTFDHAYLPNK